MVMARKKAAGTDYIPDYSYSQPVPTSPASTPKVKTSSKRSPKKSFWLFKVSPVMSVIFILFLIGISLVAQHAWLNFLGFRIFQLNNEIAKLQEENEKLKLQISAEASLDKIEEIALNQLGMIDPENIYYVYPSKDSEKPKQDQVQIAGFIPESKEKKENNNNDVPTNTWLGTVEDFFHYYLKEKR
ncbi:MAG: hypothetical protein GXY91_03605 [Clostridia bacterium]|nr:hypothetical protein [Clostridia bacterium]